MSSVQARDAKAKFSELLDAAERGETTTITRHGRAVAQISPISKASGRSIVDVLWSIPGELDIDPDPQPMREIDL